MLTFQLSKILSIRTTITIVTLKTLAPNNFLEDSKTCSLLWRKRVFFWFWLTYQFEDFALSLFLKEREPGAPFFLSGEEIGRDGRARRVLKVEHAIDWADDPLGQTWTGGVLELTYEDGGRRRITLDPQPGRFFLKGGGYGGHQGWNHGDDMGREHSDHYVWDLSDPETRRQVRQLGDHFTRVECDGAVGWGMSEYGVAKGYPKYKIAQAHEPL